MRATNSCGSVGIIEVLCDIDELGKSTVEGVGLLVHKNHEWPIKRRYLAYGDHVAWDESE